MSNKFLKISHLYLVEGTLHSQINAESTYSITISTVKSLQELCHVNHMSNMNPIVMKSLRNQVLCTA